MVLMYNTPLHFVNLLSIFIPNSSLSRNSEGELIWGLPVRKCKTAFSWRNWLANRPFPSSYGVTKNSLLATHVRHALCSLRLDRGDFEKLFRTLLCQPTVSVGNISATRHEKHDFLRSPLFFITRFLCTTKHERFPCPWSLWPEIRPVKRHGLDLPSSTRCYNVTT
jgi:hypothetical protein